jgi:hypothetical protein
MERSLKQHIGMILDAGFDGVSISITDAVPQRQNCRSFPSPNDKAPVIDLLRPRT